ncbi:OOP family OmpA-OmpF porin [Spirosoma oryzae]|uniref:OOP family OmpA-OmpF porin n=1 Tax=Spirosoma oryzae TaxID=1469603 RepID=A0A2T0SUP1_9BACT|nr:OmpA family protein [Spirosoma oryzae]PRY37131.1 OOP family OmpA-OmpF porin [Spirosoma oryzae]
MFVSKTPWILLLVLWMAGATWWHVCHIKQLCVDLPLPFSTDSTSAQGDEIAPPPISDGKRFSLELPGNFRFALSGDTPNTDALGSSLGELVTYLRNNPDRRLTIIGYYTADETTPASATNLGVARAEQFRQYLTQQGAPVASLTTQGQLITLPDVRMATTPAGDSLMGGLAFAFAEADAPQPAPPTAAAEPESLRELTVAPADTVQKKLPVATLNTEAELAAAEKFTSVFEPIDLYFKLNEANYIKTAATRQFFDEAARYLKKHKNKKLRLTGHTDNTGNDAANLRLSRDRASDVKSRLRSSGISASQIVVDAKGEADPKADNSTIAGRRANRRVTVVVN